MVSVEAKNVPLSVVSLEGKIMSCQYCHRKKNCPTPMMSIERKNFPLCQYQWPNCQNSISRSPLSCVHRWQVQIRSQDGINVCSESVPYTLHTLHRWRINHCLLLKKLSFVASLPPNRHGHLSAGITKPHFSFWLVTPPVQVGFISHARLREFGLVWEHWCYRDDNF